MQTGGAECDALVLVTAVDHQAAAAGVVGLLVEEVAGIAPWMGRRDAHGQAVGARATAVKMLF